MGFVLTTSVVIFIDYTGSFKSNYHASMTMETSTISTQSKRFNFCSHCFGTNIGFWDEIEETLGKYRKYSKILKKYEKYRNIHVGSLDTLHFYKVH